MTDKIRLMAIAKALKILMRKEPCCCERDAIEPTEMCERCCVIAELDRTSQF